MRSAYVVEQDISRQTLAANSSSNATQSCDSRHCTDDMRDAACLLHNAMDIVSDDDEEKQCCNPNHNRHLMGSPAAVLR